MAACPLCRLGYAAPHTVADWNTAVTAIQNTWRDECEHGIPWIVCSACPHERNDQ